MAGVLGWWDDNADMGVEEEPMEQEKPQVSEVKREGKPAVPGIKVEREKNTEGTLVMKIDDQWHQLGLPTITSYSISSGNTTTIPSIGYDTVVVTRAEYNRLLAVEAEYQRMIKAQVSKYFPMAS